MKRRVNFNQYRLDYWPSSSVLAPFFSNPQAPYWFPGTGNDTASLRVVFGNPDDAFNVMHGGTEYRLNIWGLPDTGVLLIYETLGTKPNTAFTSKGDLTKLRDIVRSLHDTPLPVGLFIPFDRAWLAVKEFMETDGLRLPTSIEWIANKDLPENTFPDP